MDVRTPAAEFGRGKAWGGIAVVDHPSQPLTVSPPISDADQQWLERLWRAESADDMTAAPGAVHRLGESRSLIARNGSRNIGAVCFTVDPHTLSCEVLGLKATRAGDDIRGSLLATAEECAREHRCQRISVVISNDDLDALRFFQQRGYRLVAVYAGALDAARRWEPSLPLIGSHEIPLHDELELEKRL